MTTGPSAAAGPRAGRFAALFDAEPEEGRWVLEAAEAVAGELPPSLRGRWLLAGPAGFGRGDDRFRHWLDGDGFVVSVEIAGGPHEDPRIEQRQRFVATRRRRDERAAGRILYRSFGTATPGDRLLHGLVVASAANVSVVPFADRLLACGEQGRPWELDPETLETRGEWTGGGRLTAVSPFSAHPKVDPRTGELVAFGVSYAPTSPSLTLYRFAADGLPLARRRVGLDAPISLHDMAISARWAVFWTSPYHLDVGRMRRGTSVMEALSWRPEEGASLLVLDRDTGERVARIPLGEGYCLHLFGAFETPEGRLVVDALELDRPVYDLYRPLPDLYATAGRGRPVRLEVDPRAARVVARTEIPGVPAPEFPCGDPGREGRRTDRSWCLGIAEPEATGPKLFDELVALDWRAGIASSRWRAPAGTILAGEPAFVPIDPADHGPERAGHLLVPAIAESGLSSRLLVFDAADPGTGPLASIDLARRIHVGFHAAWAPAAGVGAPSLDAGG